MRPSKLLNPRAPTFSQRACEEVVVVVVVGVRGGGGGGGGGGGRDVPIHEDKL